MIQKIPEVLRKYWGYDNYLPLQKEAMTCVINRQDSVVVLPTGGGKSLCYQAPALVTDGWAAVVSPLISLMKDQVDALNACGVPAGRLDSTQSPQDRHAVIERIQKRQLKLLYLSPERLATDGFIGFLKQNHVSFMAIDEAHCVSMWGHDFRPEYRQLHRLKTEMPNLSVHAYTATATEQVRRDIAEQLHLENPKILIGSYDRPNLVYKVRRRGDILPQVCEVLDRHRNESGIIYCIRRIDVEEMCARLKQKGYRAAPYHAGMENPQRKKNQEDFMEERINIIVATIAFGMGIDKSNIRFVIHAGMPKSLEHYQQESGRAGRDGLEAECCLVFSGGDYGLWKSILRDLPEGFKEITLNKLNEMYDYCTGITCRHEGILNYFGQHLEKNNCTACDVCLGDFAAQEDALVIAQKILSCIVRLEERFGGDYTASVLIGSRQQRLLENRHNNLSTFGLLSEFPKRVVRDWIEQLVGQDYLKKEGEYHIVKVTEKGWRVLKGVESPRLFKPSEKEQKISRRAHDSWENVHPGLFEALRIHRASIAQTKQIPAYIIFGDAALRDMARRRPSRPETFLQVNGVGEKKLRDYGADFLSVIRQYCRSHSLTMDVPVKYPSIAVPAGSKKPKKPSKARRRAFDFFSEGLPLKEIARRIDRAESTTVQYLVEYLQKERVLSPEPWVDNETASRIAHAASRMGTGRIKPIFDYFQGTVSYDQIRITLACLSHRE